MNCSRSRLRIAIDYRFAFRRVFSGSGLASAAACTALLVGTIHGWAAAEGQESGPKASNTPPVVRDLIWVWGNPEMAEAGAHTSATYAQAGPAERATLLGARNIFMAGHGLPSSDQEAEALMEQVAGFPRVVWEIAPDGEGDNRPFVYRETVARAKRLADRYPQIEGVLLDDMSSVGIDRGFKPEHIRRIRDGLSGEYARIKVWGVVYTINLDREGIGDYVRELDVILLAEWHAKNVVHIEENVARCTRLFPNKPIVLGLYLFDYGAGRRMPRDVLKQQCEAALKLAHAGRIRGIEFTTITNDPQAVAWTADWVRRVGDQRITAGRAEGL